MSLDEWVETTEKYEGAIGRAFLLLLLCATCAAFPIPTMLITLVAILALSALLIGAIVVTLVWAVMHFAAWQLSLMIARAK